MYNKFVMKRINKVNFNPEIKRVKISDLRFNPYNTRIYDLIKMNSYSSGIPEDEWVKNDEIQLKIYKHLTQENSNSDQKAIINSIKEDGLQENPVMIRGNILIAGNNRLSIIKKLIEKNEWNFPMEIDVNFIDEDFTKEEIIYNELMLQLVHTKQLDYNRVNKVLRAHELFENSSKYDDLSDDEILKITGLASSNKKYVYEYKKNINNFSRFWSDDNALAKLEGLKFSAYFDAFTINTSSPKIRNNNRANKLVSSIYSQMICLSNIKIIDTRYLISEILKFDNIETIIKELNNFNEELNKSYSNDIIKLKNFLKDGGLVADYKKNNVNRLSKIDEDIEIYISEKDTEYKTNKRTKSLTQKKLLTIVNTTTTAFEDLELLVDAELIRSVIKMKKNINEWLKNKDPEGKNEI